MFDRELLKLVIFLIGMAKAVQAQINATTPPHLVARVGDGADPEVDTVILQEVLEGGGLLIGGGLLMIAVVCACAIIIRLKPDRSSDGLSLENYPTALPANTSAFVATAQRAELGHSEDDEAVPVADEVIVGVPNARRAG